MVSVPRDTLLESGKINAAYHKGPENLRDTVSNLLGVPIDYYVAVDVDGFVAWWMSWAASSSTYRCA